MKKRMIRKHIEDNAPIYILAGLIMLIVGVVIGAIGLFVLNDGGVYLSCFPIVGVGYYLSFILLMAENPEVIV